MVVYMPVLWSTRQAIASCLAGTPHHTAQGDAHANPSGAVLIFILALLIAIPSGGTHSSAPLLAHKVGLLPQTPHSGSSFPITIDHV